jgi:group I intron endonuclease
MIIYKTTNQINGKIYVGKAADGRLLNKYLGSGLNLLKAIKLYGRENFQIKIIDVASDAIDQNRKEIFWIAFYNSRNPKIGYNISPGGDGFASGKNNPMFGRPMSEETKRKIGNTNKRSLLGRNLSDETKHKIGETLTGIKRTIETKRKISNSRKGIKFSEEHKQNMSLAHKGKPSVNKGKKLSAEHREKISLAHRRHDHCQI